MQQAVGNAQYKDYIHVSLNSDDIIVCEMYGHMTGSLVRKSLEETRAYISQLRARDQPARLFIDASNVTGQDSDARSLAKTIGSLELAKIAIYNRNVGLSLIVQYLIRSGGMASYARSFRNRRLAVGWLMDEPQAEQHGGFGLRLGTAIAVAVIAAAGLLGWIIDNEVLKAIVPGLKPINPMMSTVFILQAVALLVISRAASLTRLRTVFIAIIAGASTLIGTISLLQMALQSSGHIDGWLFQGAIGSDHLSGYVSARGALSLMLLGAAELAILSGQRKRWQQYVFHGASIVIFFMAISSLIGYGFGSGDVYPNVYLVPMPLNTALCFMLVVIAIQTAAVQMPLFARLSRQGVKYGQPIIICAVVVMITGVAWHQSVNNYTQGRSATINQELMRKKNDLQGRVNAYVSALRGYRSFFESSEFISAEEFQTFFTSSKLETYYPGVNAISFARAVSAAQSVSFITEMQRQATSTFASYKQFIIYPVSTQAVHYPVTYVQPATPTSNYGFDLATNSTRRLALEQARDTNDVAATGTIDLNASRADKTLPKRPGFFLTIPVYKKSQTGSFIEPQTVQQRRNLIYGYVNAVFEDDKLFSDIFKDTRQSSLQYVISNARSNETLYTYNPHAQDLQKGVPYNTTLKVAGQIWQLTLYAAPSFGTQGLGRYMPHIVLSGGLLVAALATALSVTQVRRKEQAVALAAAMTEDLNRERNAAVTVQQKDEAILSSIGDAVFAIDTRGIVILFNRTAGELTGKTETEALGRPYKEVFRFKSEKNGHAVDAFIKSALSGKHAAMAAGTLLERPDGSTLSVADSAAPIINSKGGVEGAVVVFRDVTREKELEHLKNEFVSMASHELRTPMGAIRAFVSMILAGDYGPVNKNLKEPLNDIRDATLRLVNLVNSLLNVARIEAGRMKFELADIAFEDTLRGVVTNLQPLAKERGLRLTATIHKLPPVQADEEKVVQVVTNLIGNALKFTDSGSITVSASRTADMVTIAVADTGTGISQDDQRKVFGKFEQVSSVQEGRPAGTGLGLYISREMVRRMGGELWIQQSELGKGTIFAFIVPRTGTPLAKRVKIDRQRDEKAHPNAV